MVYIDHSLLTKNQSILLQIIQLPVVPCWKNNDYWSMVFTKFSYHNKCLDLKIWISHKLLLGFWMTILILHVCNWNMFHYSKKNSNRWSNMQLSAPFFANIYNIVRRLCQISLFSLSKGTFSAVDLGWKGRGCFGASLVHPKNPNTPPMCVICTTIMMLDIRKSVKNDVSTTSC